MFISLTEYRARKSQDYWENKGWEMVTVPEMTMEGVLILREVLGPQSHRGVVRHTIAGLCRVMLSAP